MVAGIAWLQWLLAFFVGWRCLQLSMLWEPPIEWARLRRRSGRVEILGFAFANEFIERWLPAAALVALAAALFGIPVAQHLSAGGFQDPTSESAQAARLLSEKFAQSDQQLLVTVTDPNGATAPAARAVGTRFIHVQRNVPGMLRRLNDVFAARNVNIAAQNYQTDGEVGYVVMEAESIGADARDILREIRALEGTIRARLLYQRA